MHDSDGARNSAVGEVYSRNGRHSIGEERVQWNEWTGKKAGSKKALSKVRA